MTSVTEVPKSDGSNRLPILAAEVQRAHAGVVAAATTAAERAIEAGNFLIEAKSLLGHGKWLPWLKEHCALPERTAQFYMKIARLGLKPATVADIGLKTAGQALAVLHDSGYDPFAKCDEAGVREWKLYALMTGAAERPEPVWSWLEWVLQRGFTTPTEWLGPEGARFRRPYRMPDPPELFLRRWEAFQAEHVATTVEEIETRLRASTERPRASP